MTSKFFSTAGFILLSFFCTQKIFGDDQKKTTVISTTTSNAGLLALGGIGAFTAYKMNERIGRDTFTKAYFKGLDDGKGIKNKEIHQLASSRLLQIMKNNPTLDKTSSAPIQYLTSQEQSNSEFVNRFQEIFKDRQQHPESSFERVAARYAE